MSSSDLAHDNCGNIHILTEFSKHYNFDLAVKQEILHRSSLVDVNDYSLSTPESFNMHSLYDVISNRHQQLPHQKQPSHSNSNYYQSLQVNNVHHKPILSECESNIPFPCFSYSENNFAHDILSNAPHFPASYVLESLGSNQSINIENIHTNSKNIQRDSDICTVRDGRANKLRNTASKVDRYLCLDTTDISELENIEETTAQFWADLQKRWQVLAKNDVESHPWLVHRIETEREMAYQFSVTNEQSTEDLMEKGISLLSQGQLSSAISFFESELQSRPDNSLAWLYLGSSQAENEQDELSLSALRKCISLDPTNLDARLLLAVGYANESKNMLACKSLREWILNHPTFSSLFISEVEDLTDPPYMPSFLDPLLHKNVVSLFDRAHSSSMGNSHEIGDLYVASGILFHLAEQYSDSVIHFKHALMLQPDNPMLWNKLGATLANGERSEDAIQAYKQALKLYPNYVRCRYNLGVACMNLKSFPEACEHFLIALKLQSKGRGPTATAWNLWSTLRLAIMLGDMPKLFSLVDNRDLDSLLVEFNLHS